MFIMADAEEFNPTPTRSAICFQGSATARRGSRSTNWHPRYGWSIKRFLPKSENVIWFVPIAIELELIIEEWHLRQYSNLEFQFRRLG